MNGLETIISELEQQRIAINIALDALRGVNGEAAEILATAPTRRGRPPGSKSLGSAASHRNSEGQPQRRAARQPADTAAPARKKRRLTAAGRKRLSELMRARWASKNPPKKRRSQG